MALKPPVKLNFSRFEYKYLLPVFVAESVIARMAILMKPDFFNSSGPYIVRSLYFDSPDLQFYREKIEGDFVRKKIRLRSYGEDLKDPIYFEVKNKFADRICKDRFLINSDDYHNAVFSKPRFLLSQENKSVCRDVWYLWHYYNLSPRAVVKYERLSFIDELSECKVSFDKNIRVKQASGLFEKNLMFSKIKDSVIMEIKFNCLIPRDIIDVIREYSLERISISKYALSFK